MGFQYFVQQLAALLCENGQSRCGRGGLPGRQRGDQGRAGGGRIRLQYPQTAIAAQCQRCRVRRQQLLLYPLQVTAFSCRGPQRGGLLQRQCQCGQQAPPQRRKIFQPVREFYPPQRHRMFRQQCDHPLQALPAAGCHAPSRQRFYRRHRRQARRHGGRELAAPARLIPVVAPLQQAPGYGEGICLPGRLVKLAAAVNLVDTGEVLDQAGAEGRFGGRNAEPGLQQLQQPSGACAHHSQAVTRRFRGGSIASQGEDNVNGADGCGHGVPVPEQADERAQCTGRDTDRANYEGNSCMQSSKRPVWYFSHFQSQCFFCYIKPINTISYSYIAESVKLRCEPGAAFMSDY